jgi:hypothetical protein
MRRPYFFIAVFIFSIGILVSRVLVPKAQTSETAEVPCCGTANEIAPRQIEFPHYSLRDGFEATLFLVSALPKPLDFVVGIHSQSGQTVLAPGMTIQYQEKLGIDLRSLLTQLSADVTGDFAEGSVTVYFEGPIMPLVGQITMTNPLRRMALESEMVDNAPGLGLLPKELNGLWWGLGGGRDGKMVVTNTGGEIATADVYIDVLGERQVGPVLTFNPHETKVLNVSELLADLKLYLAEDPRTPGYSGGRGSSAKYSYDYARRKSTLAFSMGTPRTSMRFRSRVPRPSNSPN